MQDLKNLEFLLPNTQKVLKKIIKDTYLSNFILVGGSALALHICHRKSEDLDFFTYRKDSFKSNEIIKLVRSLHGEIVNISDEQIDCFIDGVKVTFFDAKWSFLKPKQIENFNLASLEQIAIMKTHTLFLRAKYRDYYDLYFLIKRFGIRKVFNLSKDVLEGINFKIFSAALLYIEDIEDESIEHLQPTQKLSLEDIRRYFENELKTITI